MMFNTGDLILDAVILSIVARTPEGTYGYKITQDVRSKMDVPESTFYPLLKQMQMDGYLEVYHKDFGGRSRRFYKITESGRERLEFCQQNWTNYLQNASTLLMGGNTNEGTTQAQAQSQPQTPQTPGTDNFDFSIGGDEPMATVDTNTSNGGDLFEFETFSAEPVAEQIQPVATSQPLTYEEPVAVEQTVIYESPVAQQHVTYEEPVTTEQPVAYEEPISESIAAPEEISENDEADFLAEMAMGDAGEALSEEATLETVTDSEMDLDGIENTFSESAEISELEDLISQLRSFEKVMSQRSAETNTPEATPASENVAIKDISGVASLLNTTPAPTAKAEQQTVSSQSTTTTPSMASASTETANTGHTPIRYKEVRNPETDDSVNSLVDLLKDDQPKKKSRFFKGWGSKKSSGAAQYAMSSAPDPKPAAKTEPVPTKPVEQTVTSTPVSAMANQDIHKSEDNNTPDSQKANLQGSTPVANQSGSNPKIQESAPAKPVEKRVIHQVEENNSVDSLVELLKGDSETKPVSIFGKASAKSYTKAKAQKTVAQPTNDTAAIPNPVVSEPKVFKPTASKTFEEKAASPNARPVETTATITKALDAKAISTKPTAAKPAEAKSVETKAVVTPKAESTPTPEEAPMDAFKARLMQAHLIPDEK